MAKKLEVALRAEEGQFLLNMSTQFNLPDKKGQDGRTNEDGYTTIEQSIARDEVRALFRDLKAYSPLAQKKGKEMRLIFGPESNTEKTGDITSIKDLDLETRVRMDEEAVSGAVWCMIFSLHPAMGSAGAVVAENVVWPLAAKLRKTTALRETLGLNNASKAKTWKTDPEPDADGNLPPVPEEKT